MSINKVAGTERTGAKYFPENAKGAGINCSHLYLGITASLSGSSLYVFLHFLLSHLLLFGRRPVSGMGGGGLQSLLWQSRCSIGLVYTGP